MKVTVVVDNSVPISAKSPFLAVHGYSLLIEHDTKKILFDMGQSQAVVNNLSVLGTSPTELDALVLSHGHWDHSGGLMHVMKHRHKRLPLYAHSDIFIPRFSIAGGSRQFAGIPYQKEQLTTLGIDWQLGETPREMFPRLWFSGQIPRITDYEHGDDKLVIGCDDGCDCQDGIDDDVALYYIQDGDLVVIGGCTHSGLVNTVKYGLKVTGAKRLRGWIGGTHLGPVAKEQQEKTLTFIEQMQPEFIMSAHCTGFDMMAELRTRFGSRFIPAIVSTVVEF